MLKALRGLIKKNKEDKSITFLYAELLTFSEMIFTQIQDPSNKILFFPRELYFEAGDSRSLNAKVTKNISNKVEITGKLTNNHDFCLDINRDAGNCYYALFYTSQKIGEIKFQGKYFFF